MTELPLQRVQRDALAARLDSEAVAKLVIRCRPRLWPLVKKVLDVC